MFHNTFKNKVFFIKVVAINKFVKHSQRSLHHSKKKFLIVQN